MAYKRCALLLEPDDDTRNLVGKVIEIANGVMSDENNWWHFIGLVRPDGTVYTDDELHMMISSDEEELEIIRERANGDWLSYVRDLSIREAARNLPVSFEFLKGIADRGGREGVITLLTDIIKNENMALWKRQLAAEEIRYVLSQDWPYPSEQASWYTQSVYKERGLDPEKAVIAFLNVNV